VDSLPWLVEKKKKKKISTNKSSAKNFKTLKSFKNIRRTG
jgi:hypothetical protein